MSIGYIHWYAIFKDKPTKAGRYLVSSGSEVNCARWLPLKGEWKFASAAQRMMVIWWADLPEPPK